MPSVKQSCPNCPGAPTALVFENPRGRVVRCLSCKLEFAESYPDLNEAEAELFSPKYFEKAIQLGEKRTAIYSQLLSEIEMMLGRKGRLLDIGCGEGLLLRVALERGWKAEGTEVSTAAIQFIRSTSAVLVHQGETESLNLEPRGFDAVVLNHVLEHVHNPAQTLARVAEWLKPDGLVGAEAPNLASFSGKVKNLQSRLGLKRNPWKHYSIFHHFWFFTRSALSQTVKTAGLQVLEVKTPAKQWGRLRAIDRVMNAISAPFNWGGHLVVYARPAKP